MAQGTGSFNTSIQALSTTNNCPHTNTRSAARASARLAMRHSKIRIVKILACRLQDHRASTGPTADHSTDKAM
ncbi:MAG: hypothetical protein EBT05_04525 [Betaproteobacteria bacterium]|nr:hypothetical protein [Betaproteobacteria bacterium]